MIRRRRTTNTSASGTYPRADLRDWVLSFPWVVERPYGLGTPGVRAFAVDCELLGRRQLWLVTGLRSQANGRGGDIAIIVPVEVARAVEDSGQARRVALMPARHVLMTVCGDEGDPDCSVQELVLSAYNYAMS